MNKEFLGLCLKTLRYQLSGRLHLPKDQVGQVFVNADGQEFVIFRQTVLDPVSARTTPPAAIFRVRFRVPKIRWSDRFLTLLKSPLFVGLPGFRSKLWMVDAKNCTYQGVYEWDTLPDAENYAHSTSMGFMAFLAVPGEISYEIIAGGTLVERNSRVSVVPASTAGARPAGVSASALQAQLPVG